LHSEIRAVPSQTATSTRQRIVYDSWCSEPPGTRVPGGLRVPNDCVASLSGGCRKKIA
jgi:hypothetical protein